MKRKMNKETLQRTTRCRHDFQCLTEGNHPKCAAERKIEGNGVFLESLEQKGCPYAMSWGYGHICTCPTRRELFTRYKI